MVRRYLVVLSFILFTFASMAPTFASGKQGQFADPSYYLIDSLNLEDLSRSDRKLLDSALTLYHNAKHDTDKLNALGIICEGLMNNSWFEYQYIQHEMIKLQIADGVPTTLERRYLYYLGDAVSNMGYIAGEQGDIEKQMDYNLKALKIREEIGDKLGIAGSLNNIGFIYSNRGDIAKTLEYYHKALKIRKEIGNKEGIANSFNGLGFTYKRQGDIPKALEYYHESLKIREEIGDKAAIARVLNNIGVIHFRQSDNAQALVYYQGALKMKEEIEDKKGIAMSLNNIGMIYKEKGDLATGLEYYHKALKIREEIGDKMGLAVSFNNIGGIYNEENEITKGLEYHYKALKIREEIQDQPGVASSFINIGSLLFKDNKLTNAEEYTLKGVELAKELGYPELIESGALLLSQIYRKQARWAQALEVYELHIVMRDSIKNEETQKASIRQQTKYEFEKAQLLKEQEEKEAARLLAEETNRRDNLQYSVILIFLLVIGGLLAVIGRFSIPERVAEGLVFFAFLLFFEFLLVLADPYIEGWSGGAPGIKLLFNAGIAALIFPAHAFFESKLKGRLVKK